MSNFNYENKELLEHIMVSMKVLGWNFDNAKVLTDIGEIYFSVKSMPAEIIQTADDEGNIIKSELAYIVECKTPRYTLGFKISVNDWYDNEKPPEVKGGTDGQHSK